MRFLLVLWPDLVRVNLWDVSSLQATGVRLIIQNTSASEGDAPRRLVMFVSACCLAISWKLLSYHLYDVDLISISKLRCISISSFKNNSACTFSMNFH